MARYLVDASALYPLVLKLREGLLDHLPLVAVLDLTVYEVGNVIWKEYRASRVKDPRALAAVLGEVLSGFRVVRVGGEALGEVLGLAIAEGITFYDAAYLHAARRLGLKLVTEDSDLKKYPESLDAEGFAAELERSK
jgi:predicted nucleic acid-binding protein